MMKHPPFPIRRKVLFFGFLMSTIPLIIVSFLYFLQMKEDLKTQLIDHEKLVSENFTRQITDKIDQTMEGLQALALLSHPEQNQGMYYDMLQQKTSVEEVVRFDPTGKVNQKVSRYELNSATHGRWLSSSELVSLQQNRQYFGKVTYNSYGVPVMKLAVPIYTGQGNEFHGGVGVTIQLQKIIGEIASHRLQNDGDVYLLDQSNKVISPQDETGLHPLSEANLEEKISYKTKVPNLNWTLVMVQPFSEAYSPLYSALKKAFWVAFAIVLLVSIISIYAGLYFTRPIEKLQNAMKGIQHGKWAKPIQFNRSDEFQDLADAFNGMSLELREKTQDLLQEKERLDIIVNGSGAGLALVRRDYSVVWMNPILEQWAENNNQNLPCYALFSDYDSPCQNCPMMVHQELSESDDLLTTLTKKGEKKFFRHRVYHLSHGTEGEDEFLVVLEDITEQREMEEKLIQTDKLSALGLMASSFAHEVNNPLATIHVYAEDLIDRLIEEGNQLDMGEVHRYLRVINENTGRCKEITTNLLNFSRKTEWNHQLFDVNNVIDESLAMIQYTFSKRHIDLSLNLASDLPLVWGDRLKFMQVIINLVNNAVDAMEDGGMLSLVTEAREEAVNISISDTGIGIPKEQLKKVFDPFYTTKPVGKGTGLGLSVCYGIINQFSGTIDMNSQENKGTTVAIQIPS